MKLFWCSGVAIPVLLVVFYIAVPWQTINYFGLLVYVLLCLIACWSALHVLMSRIPEKVATVLGFIGWFSALGFALWWGWNM